MQMDEEMMALRDVDRGRWDGGWCVCETLPGPHSHSSLTHLLLRHGGGLSVVRVAELDDRGVSVEGGKAGRGITMMQVGMQGMAMMASSTRRVIYLSTCASVSW